MCRSSWRRGESYQSETKGFQKKRQASWLSDTKAIVTEFVNMRFVGSPLRQLFLQFRAHGLPVEMQIALPFNRPNHLRSGNAILKLLP